MAVLPFKPLPWVAQVIGAPIAAALLLMEGAGGLHGWQWLFILEGAVTVVYAAILAVRSTVQKRASAGSKIVQAV